MQVLREALMMTPVEAFGMEPDSWLLSIDCSSLQSLTHGIISRMTSDCETGGTLRWPLLALLQP